MRFASQKVLLEEYPQACIEVLDSKTNCMALGLQVIEALQLPRPARRWKKSSRLPRILR